MSRRRFSFSIQKLSYKSLFIIIVFLLIGIVLLARFVFPHQKISAAWFNDGWQYRKAIPIANTLGSIINNQRVKITIDTAALISAGKLQSNCNDIRITDANGNLLDHWDVGCNTATTNLFIKIPLLPISGDDIYLYYGNSSAPNIEKTLGTSDSPGTSCQMMKDQGSVTTNGAYYIVPGGADADKQLVYCDQTTDGGGWTLVMNQKSNTGGFFANSTEAQSFNESNPTADRYSILGKLAQFKDNGVFTFKINWPGDINRNIWSQTSNPINEAITGYTAITIDQTSNGWGGLALSSTTASTFIDGSPAAGTWYYAVASYVLYVTGIPSYNPAVIQTQLWVKGSDTMNNLSAGTPAAEEISPAPTAYWKFDEGAGTIIHDSTSNQSHGTFGTGTSVPTWANNDQCISGKCLKFDGTSSYVNTNKDFSWALADKFSLGFWIKPNSVTGNQGVIGKGEAGGYGNANWEWSVRLSGSSLDFTYWNASGGGEIGLSSSVTLNKWDYFTVIYDPVNKAQLYKNGVLVSSDSTIINALPDRSTPVLFGHAYFTGGTNYFFNGYLDEIKVYSYARTPSQIKSDYASGKAHSSTDKGTSASLGSNNKNGDFLSNGLTGYWKIDEGIGTSTLDSSGNNHTGNLVGDTPPPWMPGKFGADISFNGDNYIDLGTNIVNPTTYTKTAWIKTNTSNANNIFSGTTGGHVFYVSSGSIYLSNTWSTPVITAAANYYDEKWHFIVGTYDGTTGTIYMDGIKLAQGNLVDIPANQPSYLGAFSASNFFIGQIDEVRVYNRSLSPSEISMLYRWTPGLIAYYDFNENSGTIASDKSGNSFTGTLGSGNSAPTWTSGKYGSALNWDGLTNKYISLPNVSRLGSRSWTISSWVQIPSTVPARVGTLLGNYPDSPHLNLEVVSAMRTYWNGEIDQSGTTNLKDNKWHYLSYVRDQYSNNFYMYVDGVLEKAIPGVGTDLTFNAPFWIGSDKRGGGLTWHGKIDEVRIYDYARSSTQINEDMLGDHPSVSHNSMVGHYKLDEGSGGLANNSGSQGTNLTGTLMNSPTWTNDGKFNKGILLDGLNDYIEVADKPSTKYIGGELSLSLWIKLDPTDDGGRILSKPWNGSGQYNYWFSSTGGANPSIDFGLSGDVGFNLNYTQTITSNEWHYLAVTISTDKLVQIYLDGKLNNSGLHTITSWTPTLGDANLPLALGTYFPYGGMWAGITNHATKGSIDEIKIYKSLLSANEIALDYNHGSALQLGSLSASTSNAAPSNASSQQYCVPGDSSICSAPVAEWNFEENTGSTTADSSGNNHTGTLGTGNSAPTWTVGQNNKGSGLKFDGINDVLNAPNINSINLTASMWIFPTSWNQPTATALLTQRASNYDGLMVFVINGGNLSFDFGDGSSQYRWDTGYVPPLNTWTYLTISRDANGRYLYVNGKLQNSTTIAGGPMTTASILNIGHANYSGPYYFQGKMDQIRIYNYIRTPAQIAYDYNRGNPIGWWKLNECQGAVANDSSGMGNTGSISIGAAGSQTSPGTCSDNLATSAWNNGKTGKYNSSLNFDGADDFISIPQYNLTSNASISTWVKGSYLNGNQIIIGSKDSISLGLFISGSDNGLIGSSGISKGVGIANNFINDSWNHLVVTFDNLGNANYFCNGKLLIISGTNNWSWAESAAFIGKRTAGNFFKGQIDDTRIYNYALTSEQIKTLYNNGSVSFGN